MTALGAVKRGLALAGSLTSPFTVAGRDTVSKRVAGLAPVPSAACRAVHSCRQRRITSASPVPVWSRWPQLHLLAAQSGDWDRYPPRRGLATPDGGVGENRDKAGGGPSAAARRRDRNRDDERNGDGGGDEEDEENEDVRPSDSVYYILTGRTQPNPSEQAVSNYNWPKSVAEWRDVLSKTWESYIDTFEGWDLDGEREKKEKEDKKKREEDEEDLEHEYIIEYDEEGMKRKRKEIVDNLGRNLNEIETTGRELLEQTKTTSGIQSKEDLKRWAGDQIKLATESLSEFMNGYREGRDEELDRMLNEYFKDVDDGDDRGEEKEEKEGSFSSEVGKEEHHDGGGQKRTGRRRRRLRRRNS